MAKKEWKQRLIPKKALFRASLIWETWVQTCYNYERMMGMAFHVSLVWLFLLKRKKLWATIFRMNSLQISRLP